jgi:hypothetical protein
MAQWHVPTLAGLALATLAAKLHYDSIVTFRNAEY